jgi:hypothetical protein
MQWGGGGAYIEGTQVPRIDVLLDILYTFLHISCVR